MTVYLGSVGLLFRDGVYDRTLPPGRHLWWDWGARTRAALVPIVPQMLPLAPIELLTKDQFAFRITVMTVAQVTDPLAYYNPTWLAYIRGGCDRVVPSLSVPRLEAALAAAWVESVAQRTLEGFLEAPLGDDEKIRASIAQSHPGVDLLEIRVTQITLPPEVRKMFTEVERSRREGLAMIERSRAEQASLRALANAARAMKDNPDLAQLRALQTMETARGNKTFVLAPTSGPAMTVT